MDLKNVRLLALIAIFNLMHTGFASDPYYEKLKQYSNWGETSVSNSRSASSGKASTSRSRAASLGKASTSKSKSRTPKPPETEVKLYVYDISHKFLKAVGMPKVYHSSIVVFNEEFFFTDGGICRKKPGKTHFGDPISIELLGTTKKTWRQFIAEIERLKGDRFTGSRYSLINHNCNTFSDEISKFLVGRGIPDYILSLQKSLDCSVM